MVDSENVHRPLSIRVSMPHTKWNADKAAWVVVAATTAVKTFSFSSYLMDWFQIEYTFRGWNAKYRGRHHPMA
jgi:hypothetical protein